MDVNPEPLLNRIGAVDEFDEHPETTSPSPIGLKLAYDFRMTDDQANADGGGCCGSAADGIGVGIFDTAMVGTSGAIDPGVQWEDPALSGGGSGIASRLMIVPLSPGLVCPSTLPKI